MDRTELYRLILKRIFANEKDAKEYCDSWNKIRECGPLIGCGKMSYTAVKCETELPKEKYVQFTIYFFLRRFSEIICEPVDGSVSFTERIDTIPDDKLYEYIKNKGIKFYKEKYGYPRTQRKNRKKNTGKE